MRKLLPTGFHTAFLVGQIDRIGHLPPPWTWFTKRGQKWLVAIPDVAFSQAPSSILILHPCLSPRKQEAKVESFSPHRYSEFPVVSLFHLVQPFLVIGGSLKQFPVGLSERYVHSGLHPSPMGPKCNRPNELWQNSHFYYTLNPTTTSLALGHFVSLAPGVFQLVVNQNS